MSTPRPNRHEGRLPNGAFAPGNRASVGHGRPPGTIQVKAKLRAVLGRELLEALARGDETLPGAFARWASLLKSPDERIRLEAEKFLFEVTHGRAPVTLQLAGPGGSGELILRWQEARPGAEARALSPPQGVQSANRLTDGSLQDAGAGPCPPRAQAPSGAAS